MTQTQQNEDSRFSITREDFYVFFVELDLLDKECANMTIQNSHKAKHFKFGRKVKKLSHYQILRIEKKFVKFAMFVLISVSDQLIFTRKIYKISNSKD